MTKGPTSATKPPVHPEDGDRVSSENVRRPSRPDEAVCPRKFNWILLPRNLQYLFHHIWQSVSVHIVDLGAHWWIFVKFDIWIFCKNPLRRFKFHSNLTRITVIYVQTYVHLWKYLAEFFLEWEKFQTKVVDKISTHILCSTFFFPRPWKSCHLWSNVEKYGRARQATDGNIIKLMHFACWITKATNSHSEYVILNCFSAAKMVSQTRLFVTLYIHCLSCFVWISDLMWQWSSVIFLRPCWLQQRIHFIAHFWTQCSWQAPALMHYIHHLGVVGF